jgi:hypothetical protein
MAEKIIENLPTNEPRVFGMTRNEVSKATDASCDQRDQNHPTATGTYQEFIKNVQTGSKALSSNSNYCKNKP